MYFQLGEVSGARLANVKIDGAVSGKLFEDRRKCDQGIIHMAVTNGNDEMVMLKVSDPEGNITFLEDLPIEPGLTVVPWQTHQDYHGGLPVTTYCSSMVDAPGLPR